MVRSRYLFVIGIVIHFEVLDFLSGIVFKMVSTGIGWRWCSLRISKRLSVKACNEVFQDENWTFCWKGKGMKSPLFSPSHPSGIHVQACSQQQDITASILYLWPTYDLCYFWQSGAEYVIRVSFGTALIASIVIVYTAIIALLSSRRSFICQSLHVIAISSVHLIGRKKCFTQSYVIQKRKTDRIELDFPTKCPYKLDLISNNTNLPFLDSDQIGLHWRA